MKFRQGTSVVIVNDTGHINGGAASVAITSALALARLKVAVTFVCMVSPIDDRLTRAGIRSICLEGSDLLSSNRLSGAIKGLWNFEAVQKLRGLLESMDKATTVVHFHGYYKAFSASVLSVVQRLGFRATVTLHDYFAVCPNGGLYDYQKQRSCNLIPMSLPCLTTHCDSRKYSHKVWRVVRQAVAERMDASPFNLRHVIYISEYSRQLLQPHFRTATNWHYVPNPIDIDQGERVEAEINTILIFIGRVAQEKGVDVFCEAAMRAGLPGCVVGDGPMLAYYRARYPIITFTGWSTQAKIQGMLGRARALVMPSRWHETQGLVVLEAAARGVPAVVADQTAASASILHGVNGLIFPNGNVAALQAALQRLDDRQLVKELSVGAYELFWRAPPTPSAHAAALLNAYSQM